MISVNNQTLSTGVRPLRVRWLTISAFCTFSFALLLTFAAGCGPTERQRVQTVSDQFLDAMSREDWDRAKPLLTEKARDAMAGINPLSQDGGTSGERRVSISSPVENYTLGEPGIHEETAAVPVTLTGTDGSAVGTLRLRREDGEWRVRALRIEGENDAPGITLDFEDPAAALLEPAFQAIGEGIGEMLKGVGRGMGAFLQGVEEGAAAAEKSEKRKPLDEFPEPPQASPGSDGAADIREHSGDS